MQGDVHVVKGDRRHLSLDIDNILSVLFFLQKCGPYLRSLRIPPRKHEDECGSDEDCSNKVRPRKQQDQIKTIAIFYLIGKS